MNADLNEKILKLKEAEGLPESFILNIIKIANEQDKFSDQKWIKKMLINAKIKHEQQSKYKIKKEFNNKDQNKIEKINLLNKESKQSFSEKNFQIIEAQKCLPYLEKYPKVFPRVSFAALVFIQKKYGFWTLRMLSVLEDKNKIYTNFAIKFASVLSTEINIQNCIDLGLHKNPELLYKTVVSNPKYIENKSEIEKYHEWKKNEYFERKKEMDQQNYDE
ncbi:hypothetical protein [Fluviispira sanaruensis]|uniref:Uncharacterized protein n=1 Tax=Fluviispira sanaruensis TaxID=2493639 RepID=A0A4P2VYC4_FLUSA|nr:hypothetical protein [Fluviispira sanaruensis]BBH54695.1 hypothetical protein JCM31447_31690 [Fluviispira sanaruensis]